MKLTIRKATVDDIDAIYRLSSRVHLVLYDNLIPANHLSEFVKNYSLSDEVRNRYFEYFLPRINDPKWYIYVAQWGKRIVGYTKGFRLDNFTLFKNGLFVDPDYQSRGIGTALLNEFLRVTHLEDSIFLAVVKGNVRAQRFYEKNGFVKQGYSEKKFHGAKLINMCRKNALLS